MKFFPGGKIILKDLLEFAEINRLAHRYRARFLVDAAQLVGRREAAMKACGIDCLAFSAHKTCTPPFGILND